MAAHARRKRSITAAAFILPNYRQALQAEKQLDKRDILISARAPRSVHR